MSRLYDAIQKAESSRAEAIGLAPDSNAETDRPTPASAAASTWQMGVLAGVVGATLAIGSFYLLTERTPGQPIASDKVVAAPPVALGDIKPRPSDLLKPDPPNLAPEAAAIAAGREESGDAAVAPASDPPTVTEASVDGPETAGRAASTGGFTVQVGAFENRDNATQLMTQLVRRNHTASVHSGRLAAAPWVVHVGRYADRQSAETARLALASEGFAGFAVTREP